MFACLKQGFASHNCTVELKRSIFMPEVEGEEVLLVEGPLSNGRGGEGQCAEEGIRSRNGKLYIRYDDMTGTMTNREN